MQHSNGVLGFLDEGFKAFHLFWFGVASLVMVLVKVKEEIGNFEAGQTEICELSPSRKTEM